jgi:UDP-glucose 4-epimerase
VERLLKEGKRVRVIDNYPMGRRDNLDGHSGKAELVEGDILDLKLVRRAVQRVEIDFHLGSEK